MGRGRERETGLVVIYTTYIIWKCCVCIFLPLQHRHSNATAITLEGNLLDESTVISLL